MNASELKTVTHKKAKGRSAAMYLVTYRGVVVGLLEKYRNTRTDKHPWKVFAGEGMTARFLGAFYGPQSTALAALATALSPAKATAIKQAPTPDDLGAWWTAIDGDAGFQTSVGA